MEPFDPRRSDALGAGEKDLADSVERIGLAPAVAELLVLNPPADLVQTTVRDTHHTKRIRDTKQRHRQLLH